METVPEEGHELLTNGNADINEKDKRQKSREWEKHRPPWVDELKLTKFKSTKSPPVEDKSERKSISPGLTGPSKSEFSNPSPSAISITQSGETPKTVMIATSRISNQRPQSMFIESPNKIVEKPKEFSPSKTADILKTTGNHVNQEEISISKKDYLDLKEKVDKLEKLVKDLTFQVKEETENRKILEKELIKLRNLATQV